jgi:hypothetical protein
MGIFFVYAGPYYGVYNETDTRVRKNVYLVWMDDVEMTLKITRFGGRIFLEDIRYA